jgi:hypothetical protein
MKKLILSMLAAVLFACTGLQAQDSFTFKEGDEALAAMERQNQSNPKAKLIQAALAEKGFVQDGTATWLSGTYGGQYCELLIADYTNENGQTASQILQIKGGEQYSAMDIFKDPNNAATNFGYEEHYVDRNNNLVLTHSFFSCFFNTISQKCGPIVNVNEIWNKCKKYLPFKLSKFFNCVYNTAVGQVNGFLNCLWSNLWSAIWKCL